MKQKQHYEKLAEEHVDFLCSKVFKPAFIMGFVHGAKHALESPRRIRKKGGVNALKET